MMTATHEPASAAGDPRFTALALAIMELSPESSPAWVRAIGPALPGYGGWLPPGWGHG